MTAFGTFRANGIRVLITCLFLLLPLHSDALVDMRILNYSDTWTDYQQDFPGYTFRIVRSYNSRSLHRGLFGFGWCSDFEDRLYRTPEGTLIFVKCGDGSTSRFIRSGYATSDYGAATERLIERLRALDQDDQRL